MGGHGKGYNRIVRGFSKVAQCERNGLSSNSLSQSALDRLAERIGHKKRPLSKEAVFFIPLKLRN